MRPIRRYRFVFTHPTYPERIVLAQIGQTPCAARNAAFGMLEELLKTDEAYPRDNKWKMASQEDCGIVG